MNQLKTFILFRLLILVIFNNYQYQQSEQNERLLTKIAKNERKLLDHNHDKYINTQESNKLTSANFSNRLKQGKLATKNEIADFVKGADFDEKLKKLI